MKDEAKPRRTADFRNALAVVAANPEELFLAQALAEAAERMAEPPAPEPVLPPGNR